MKTIFKNSVLLLMIAALTLPVITKAQGRKRGGEWEERKEKIESHRIAFLTEEMNLSPEDASKFWPVYNQHRQLVDSLRMEFRENHDYSPEDIQKMSDKEASDFLDDRIEHEQQMQNLHFEFVTDLKGILNPHQILKMIRAEDDFKLRLMHQVRRGGPPEDMRR